MYFQATQQFIKTLNNLDAILQKAIDHAQNKKFDPNNFCTMRLSPNMFPFTKQVQMVCDIAKFSAACLSSKPAPTHEDKENTLPQLQERIKTCVAYLESFKESDFQQLNSKTVINLFYPAGKAMLAQEFLLSRSFPNFFFHASIVYALVRMGGVDIGKLDFLGHQNLMDAPQ